MVGTIGMGADDELKQRVKDAIANLLSKQTSTGGFGLWGPSDTTDLWLDSYVTDFLTRARERGFAVPDTAFKQAIERLRNYVGNIDNPAKDGGRSLCS